MERVDYHEYIDSPEWRARANAAKARAGYRCQVCNRSRNEVTLDAHHRTYERLGNELPEDITVLCRDCHELYEAQKRLPKPPSRRQKHGNGSYPLDSLPPIVEPRRTTLPRSDGPKSIPSSSIPSEYRLDVVPVEQGEDADDGVWDDGVSRHMLVWLGRFVHFFGYTGNGILIIALEWTLIAENPLNLINPFFHLSIVWGVLSSPLFWMLSAIALVGAGLTIASAWLVQQARPRVPVLRWYWRWRPTLLLTAPIFLTSWANGAYAIAALIFTVIVVLAGGVEPSLSLFGSNLLRIYLALLLLPVLHLIWDSRLRHVWLKLLMSLVIAPTLLLASLVVELWWGAEMCTRDIGEESMCQFYTKLPEWVSPLLGASSEGSIETHAPTITTEANPTPIHIEIVDWSNLTSQSGLVTLEYPTGWQVQRDTDEAIELHGPETAFTLYLMPGNTEGDITATINQGQHDPDFVDTYNKPLRDYLETEFEKFDGGLVRLGNPVIDEIGGYSTISNDVEYFEAASGTTQAKRMWIYLFDCELHLCQVMFAKSDSSPISKEQQRIAEHIIASIVVDNVQPAPAPLGTQEPKPTDTFSGLSFCAQSAFHFVGKKCTRNQAVFDGVVQRLYVSWTPSKEYRGARFLAVWYIDGNFIFERESTDEYGYIEVDTRPSLKPGKYEVEVYVDDTLVTHGGFEIR